MSAPLGHPFSSAGVAHRAKEVDNRILTDASAAPELYLGFYRRLSAFIGG
jgi:hypothetical protein